MTKHLLASRIFKFSFILIIVFIVCLNIFPKVNVASKEAVKEVITDETIVNYFKNSSQELSSHRIMMRNRENLHAMLDGFMLGDVDAVKNSAEQLARAMEEVAREYPPTAEKEAVVWKAMSVIADEVQLLKKATDANDYNKAYTHYTRITAQCIQCHQSAREWGKLPILKPKTKVKVIEKTYTADKTSNGSATVVDNKPSASDEDPPVKAENQ